MTTFSAAETPFNRDLSMLENLLNRMPNSIKRLPELAYNLKWSWTPEARGLFKQLDYTLWRRTQHNPVQMLNEVSTSKLDTIAADETFLTSYQEVMKAYDVSMDPKNTWFYKTFPNLRRKKIAYFSMEFGMHNSLPIYSGGLGILSGDHTKEAGDLGIPLVCVGFMYPQGYFRQRLSQHGDQEAVYVELDMDTAPIQVVTDSSGEDVMVEVNISGRIVYVRSWFVQVGQTPLYLLDTDVDQNMPQDRELSARLYSGDSEMRIQQEMLLGIAGVRMLHAVGVTPDAYHLNEGHSSFLLLECIRRGVQSGLSFEESADFVKQHTVFTTHTPVPAGHDVFNFEMMGRYFAGFWDEMGISFEQFIDLGRHGEYWGDGFNMTVLALNMAGQANGVSELHGQVSREMWHHVFSQLDVPEVPIIGITNGVHMPTWLSSETKALYTKHLGKDWAERHDESAVWENVSKIPDDELWALHEQLKRKLFGFLRERVRVRWVEGRTTPTQTVTAGTMLDPEALTIGFARRFATYKRANLIFRDLPRLQNILLDTHRPVQFVFAGKAHPKDQPGQDLIREIYNFTKQTEIGGRIAFIEDYDMHMARYLVQGVDVWLNNPRRPREASGTSGMKAAANGVPNFSILDGWWAESYNGKNGWAIGDTRDYDDLGYQDDFDAKSIYETLEQQIIPLFYDRNRDDVPEGWVEMMRESIKTSVAPFSTRRMLKDYMNKLYLGALEEKVKA